MFRASSCNCLCPIQWSQVLTENEDVVGAAPTGDAPATSEWSTILLPTKVRLILETWRYYQHTPYKYCCIPNTEIKDKHNVILTIHLLHLYIIYSIDTHVSVISFRPADLQMHNNNYLDTEQTKWYLHNIKQYKNVLHLFNSFGTSGIISMA